MSQIIHIARVTIEFTTAFHVGSGKVARGADAGIVLDANGLPALPGSSIQGVLRQTSSDLGIDAAEWFGFDDRHPLAKSVKDCKNGRRSHVEVSWGLIHNRHNQPVEGLLAPGVIQSDEVLRHAFSPPARDHVRLTHLRSAADQGKFDELAVAAGHRFTFELKLTASSPEDTAKWHQLLASLKHPLVRIGGKTRRGFGAFKIFEILAASFDLAEESQRQALLDWPVELREQPVASAFESKELPGRAFQDHACELQAAGLWMIGGGSDPDADSAPVCAARIAWDARQQGHVEECFLIPGSAIKGALAHRTCFHANRLARVFADEIEDFGPVTGSNNTIVKLLFGELVVHERDEGRPGLVFIDDVYLPLDTYKNSQLPPQNHVAIDPFTGGAKDTALFQDRPLHNGCIPVPIHLDMHDDAPAAKVPVLPGKEASPLEAFAAAIDDLRSGRLAIGAHSSRGYGFFTTNTASAS